MSSSSNTSNTTFTIPATSTPIAVHVPDTPQTRISQDELLGFPAFKTWLATLQHSLALQIYARHPFHRQPYTLRRIDVTGVDRFGGGRLGFVKLAADVSNADGEKLPGVAFLRGGSVAMMVILQPDDVPASSETDKHILLTVQARIPAGSLAFVELPAGMLDDAGTFAGAAAKEIKEELDLEVPADQLLDLTALALQSCPSSSPSPSSGSGGSKGNTDDKAGSNADKDKNDSHSQQAEQLQNGVYVSPGGSDEYIPIFLHTVRVPRQQLRAWSGKLTGNRAHGEKITLKCVPLADAWRAAPRDAKLLSALALYHGLRGEGRL